MAFIENDSHSSSDSFLNQYRSRSCARRFTPTKAVRVDRCEPMAGYFRSFKQTTERSASESRAHTKTEPLVLSSAITQAATSKPGKAKGTCTVCHSVLHLHNKDGSLHKHGPRKKPCPGSHKPPLTPTTAHRVSLSGNSTVSYTHLTLPTSDLV